jgi:serine/threonine protein kinase
MPIDSAPCVSLPLQKWGVPESSSIHQLCDVAEGLNYLHSCNVIHGSIRGVWALRLINNLADIVQFNILVDHFSRARITDFAFAIVDRDQGPASDVTVVPTRITRWTAPETTLKQPPTKKSDVFSFAMLMVEVGAVFSIQQRPANRIVIPMKILSGVPPFLGYLDAPARFVMSKGARPLRPTDPDVADDVWALMEMCWHEKPSSRPEMRRVLQDLVLSLYRSLHQSIEPSPEFQVALCQFYDSTERKGCINRLNDAELKGFIKFLDDVRTQLNRSNFNPGYDFSYRCYAPRNRIWFYYREYCTTCRRCAASGPHFQTPT